MIVLQEWMTFFINLFRMCVRWLSQMTIFNVPLIAVLVGIVCLGVLLRALLYKA